ncbi:hypothetical protein QQZ08_001807 [Neonectria magnoliae]|uniref:Protein kinase domain-containing protein n=1 Tax=Neonectria magnoliae TaxID=2732573 RepID=A0ABR1IDF2_9HYPO
MPKQRASRAIPKELPLCDGPTLGLFQHHASNIQWFERLGGDDEGTPAEGYVFRAKIRKREYAIKIFKFYDPRSNECFWEPLLGDDVSLETIAYYTDPFYSECRAYGRIHQGIKKRELKPDVVIPCHGFFFLREKDKRILDSRNINLELDKVDHNYQRSTVGGYRVRAIVKDLASAGSGVNGQSLRRILEDIVKLNSLRIYNMDIRLDNYRDGKLVDFGASWTEPHILLDELDDETATEYRIVDRAMFDRMVKDEGIANPKRIVALHRMKLRSRPPS